MPQQRVTSFALDGGEDVVSPNLVVKPGRLRASKNYEPRTVGGYRRIDGYERYDGQPKPSLANQAFFNIDAVTNTVAVGDKLTGSISSAVAYVVGETSGVGTAYDFPDTDDLFVDNDILTNVTQANTYATVDLSTTAMYGPYTTNSSTLTGFIGAAQGVRRALIGAVPGSGIIRGIFRLSGDLYAFRDNAGGTATDLYKATSAGWVLQTLGYSLAYTTGATAKFIRGEIVTMTGGAGGSGARTGIVTAVNITSGTFGGGTAVGTVYYHTLSGVMGSGTLTGTDSLGTAAVAAGSTAITLNAGGKHDIITNNFFGQSDSNSVYGASGVSDAYMWNGSGMALMPEAAGGNGLFPTHIVAHKSHLMVSFLSSIIISNIGDPFSFTAIGDALEIAVGDVITGFASPQGDVLAVFSANSTRLLYGTSGADWNLKVHSKESGAKEWTIQRVGQLRYLDDRGLTQLTAVQDFGDFSDNAFSKYINPIIKTKLGLQLDSVVVREKDQYRIFFSDKTGVIARIPEGGGFPHFTRIEYPITVNNCITTEDSTGLEELFFGSSTAAADGYVYQMDSGNSFDSASLDYFARLPYNAINSPRNIKRFFKLILEVESEIGVDSTVDIKFNPDFSYGNPERPKGVQQTFELTGGGAYWGEGAEWADFFWGQASNEAEGYIKGSGRNISIAISGSSTLQGSHTLTGMTIQYAIRGVKK